MIEFIAAIIFLISLLGIAVILYFKLPVLATLPKNRGSGIRKTKIASVAENKIKDFLAFFSDGMILHKFLSWTKCKIIKTETWIDDVLHGIRKKAKEQKLNGKK